MTTQSLVITVRTKLWILSEGIIHGPVYARTSKTTANLVRPVLGLRHHDTDHMVTSDNFLFLRSLGIQYLWILLNNCLLHSDSPLFW
jgi:hypothetical protein